MRAQRANRLHLHTHTNTHTRRARSIRVRRLLAAASWSRPFLKDVVRAVVCVIPRRRCVGDSVWAPGRGFVGGALRQLCLGCCCCCCVCALRAGVRLCCVRAAAARLLHAVQLPACVVAHPRVMGGAALCTGLPAGVMNARACRGLSRQYAMPLRCLLLLWGRSAGLLAGQSCLPVCQPVWLRAAAPAARSGCCG